MTTERGKNVIGQKAPKDMTAVEFVAMIEESGKSPLVSENDKFYTLGWIKNKLNEPAPNPFTPDQLAWMREEQRAGYNYAAKDCNGYVYIHTSFPQRLDYTWDSISNKKTSAQRMFLSNVLSWNDPEPLCFADYAPLEVNHE